MRLKASLRLGTYTLRTRESRVRRSVGHWPTTDCSYGCLGVFNGLGARALAWAAPLRDLDVGIGDGPYTSTVADRLVKHPSLEPSLARVNAC